MVINGYSEVMQEVFGQAGVGVRSAVGMILPHGIYTEVQNICASAHLFSVVAAWFLCRISAHLLIYFVAAWFLNGCILMHKRAAYQMHSAPEMQLVLISCSFVSEPLFEPSILQPPALFHPCLCIPDRCPG